MKSYLFKGILSPSGTTRCIRTIYVTGEVFSTAEDRAWRVIKELKKQGIVHNDVYLSNLEILGEYMKEGWV